MLQPRQGAGLIAAEGESAARVGGSGPRRRSGGSAGGGGAGGLQPIGRPGLGCRTQTAQIRRRQRWLRRALQPPPELGKHPREAGRRQRPVVVEAAFLAAQHRGGPDQRMNQLQGLRPGVLREMQQENGGAGQAGLQTSQGAGLQPALVGPPQPLALRPAGQHDQLAAALAAGQGHGGMESRLVVEAQLALQGHRDGGRTAGAGGKSSEAFVRQRSCAPGAPAWSQLGSRQPLVLAVRSCLPRFDHPCGSHAELLAPSVRLGQRRYRQANPADCLPWPPPPAPRVARKQLS